MHDRSRTPESLCLSCAARRDVVTARGARFLLCERSRSGSKFPKYPMQPVVRCSGFEPRAPGPAGGAVPGA